MRQSGISASFFSAGALLFRGGNLTATFLVFDLLDSVGAVFFGQIEASQAHAAL